MITKEDLKIILQEGEGYKVEFKEDLSGIDKEMVAFANSSGGRIFLGINDKNEVQGVKISNRLRAQIQDIANNCDPKIKIENFWVKPRRFILGETVFRRNNLIVDLFSRIHFGERMGTGFERIKEICKRENAPFPKIEFSENYFYVDFKQSREYLRMAGEEKAKEEILVVLNKRQKKEIEFTKKNGRLTIKEYIKLFPDVNRKTLTRDMNHLIKLGLIKRKGKGRRDLHYVPS